MIRPDTSVQSHIHSLDAGAVVVIIDDESALREALQNLLASTNLHADSFGSAEEFLCSPQCDTARCLILDVNLPGMDGLSLHRRLRDDGRRIPTVFVTAHEDGDGLIRKQALEAGALAVLRKPFSDEELLRIVRGALAD